MESDAIQAYLLDYYTIKGYDLCVRCRFELSNIHSSHCLPSETTMSVGFHTYIATHRIGITMIYKNSIYKQYIYIIVYIHRVSEKRHKLFRSELREMSINFNNFQQVDYRINDTIRIAKVLYHIYISLLTSLISPPYLVTHKTNKFYSISAEIVKNLLCWRNEVEGQPFKMSRTKCRGKNVAIKMSWTKMSLNNNVVCKMSHT